MALDQSTGWNTPDPWATPDTNALVSGLTQAAGVTPAPATAAVADPTSTPTTRNPTSAARMLGTAMPQPSQAAPTGGLLAQTVAPMLAAGLQGLGQSKLSVSTGTPLTSVAPNSTSNVAPGNTAAKPPATVAVPSGTGGGDYTYYKWNDATGSYVVAGSYNTQTKQGYTDPNRAAQLTLQISQAQRAMQQFGSNADGMGMSGPQYQQAMESFRSAQQELQSLKFDPSALEVSWSGTPLVKGSPDNGVSQVNQQYSQQIDTYKGGAAEAKVNQQAAAQTANVNAAVAYMNTHGGQMDPNVVLPASVVSAAQDAYKQQQDANGPAFTINGASSVMPIDTTTADIAGVNAQNAITSQYNTNLGGADAGAISRAAAFAHTNQSGANQITHDTAAAQSFNTNLASFGNALQAQATADTNATGAKLNADIQAVGDVAARLQQQISTLDAATQQQVRTQIDQLNQQIAYYKQQVAQYGSDVGFVMNLAKGILAGGAAIATIMTGGVAGVAIGAAAGVAGAAIK